MLAFLIRLWSIFVGLVMILLSLAFQYLALILLLMCFVPLGLLWIDPRISLPVIFLTFNGLCCYDYFVKRRVTHLRGRVDSQADPGVPYTTETLLALFLLPRGIDRILTGRDLSLRV